MIAVWKDGKREEVAFHNGVQGTRETEGFVQLEPGQRSEDIKEFIIERTSWMRGEIKGIALNPGMRPLSVDPVVKPASPTATSTKKTQTFGPTIERTLSLSETLQDAFLDLDTGTVSSAPKEMIDQLRAEGQSLGAPEAVREWMRTNGADVLVTPDDLFQVDGLAPLIAVSGTAEIDKERFDKLSAEEVTGWLQPIQKAHDEGTHAQSLWHFKFQDIYAFKTGDGAIGVLQVEHTARIIPRRVKVHDKLRNRGECGVEKCNLT